MAFGQRRPKKPNPSPEELRDTTEQIATYTKALIPFDVDYVILLINSKSDEVQYLTNLDKFDIARELREMAAKIEKGNKR